MHSLKIGFASAVLLGALSARASATLQVVATVPDLAALARDIGGAHVTVKSLSLATQDPHFVDARPSLALALSHADVLLAVGLDLEIGWLPPLLVGARNGAIQRGGAGHVDCSRFVKPMDVAQQPVDRSQGDIHPSGNPHYFTDPRALAAVAAGIAARFGELDPTHAPAFKQNLDALVRRLMELRQRWEKRLAAFRGAPVVSYHKTFTYLADWLGLTEVGFLEPKPGIPPNPTAVARLLGLARARKVRLLLQESFYPEGTARLVADKIPATLLRVPGAASFETGEGCVDRLDKLVAAIEHALTGGTGGAP